MELGINCFGLNDALVDNKAETFKQLKEIGLDYLEPIVLFKTGLPMPVESAYQGLKAKKLDGKFWCETAFEDNYNLAKEAGLKIIGCQISGMLPVQGGVTAQVDDMIALGKRFGLEYFVLNPKKKGLKNAQIVAETIKALKDKLNEEGFELYVHNHSEEFFEENGTCFFEYLMSYIPSLKVELDVGWVYNANADVIEVMHKYRNRIVILHLKDLYAGNTAVFPAIGEGVIPLEDILKVAKELNLLDCGLIFDQDNSANDIIADTKTGIGNIKKYL